MEQRVQQKRKVINLGIKTKLQLKYLKLIVGTVIIMMVIVGLTFYGTFHLILSTAQLGRYAETRLSEIFSWLNWLLIGECIIFTLIAGFLSLKLTHKLAGPLYRLEKMIREAVEKETVEEIKIREGDDLQYLTSELNNLISKLTKKG